MSGMHTPVAKSLVISSLILHGMLDSEGQAVIHIEVLKQAPGCLWQAINQLLIEVALKSLELWVFSYFAGFSNQFSLMFFIFVLFFFL